MCFGKYSYISMNSTNIKMHNNDHHGRPRLVCSLFVLALLACPKDTYYDTELFCKPTYTRACSIITRFINRVITRRHQLAELVRNASLEECTRGVIQYDEVSHEEYQGSHVIDSEGNHHIICQNIPIPQLPIGTTSVTLVIYKDQHGYFDRRYASECVSLAEWTRCPLQYRTDTTGLSIVRLAKFGIFTNENGEEVLPLETEIQ